MNPCSLNTDDKPPYRLSCLQQLRSPTDTLYIMKTLWRALYSFRGVKISPIFLSFKVVLISVHGTVSEPQAIGNIYLPPVISKHDDVIKWKHFPRYWPFVRGIHRPPCEFPTQRPVTRSFDVFFDLHPNKRLSKQWWGWWFETSPCPLRRHRDEFKRGKNIYFVYGSKSIGPFSLFVFPGYRCDVVWRVYRPNWGNIYKKKNKRLLS